MSTRKRYVIEGEWSGYTSAQRRIVHRTVTKCPELYTGLTGIRYTDNTTLRLTVRPCAPREKVIEIHGYDKLIADASASRKKGVVSVVELRKGTAK